MARHALGLLVPLNRALIPIFLIVLVDVFGLTLVLPLQTIMPNTWARRRCKQRCSFRCSRSVSSSQVRCSAVGLIGLGANRCCCLAKSARSSVTWRWRQRRRCG